MMNTDITALNRTVQETNELLNDICAQFGWTDHEDIAYDLLRAVLHTVRDRLPVDEAANLGATLPMLVRGIYYEGWDPSATPVKMDKEEFLENVRSRFPMDSDISITKLIQGIFKALDKYVSKGEFDDIKANFPEDLATLLKH